MLREIIETLDLNFSNYHELEKNIGVLTKEDRKEIISWLDEFRSDLYTEKQEEILNLIELRLYPGGMPSKYIHGCYHVEKVFMYMYLIIKKYNERVSLDERIPEELKKILYYVAFYHDIGRVDNSEDISHGFNSAKIFHKLFKDEPFFKSDERRLLLAECLMNLHSKSDEVRQDVVITDITYEYNPCGDWTTDAEAIKEYVGEYWQILVAMVKDADALDRKRFGDWDRASLDDNYLRTIESKNLIVFAAELNKWYYAKLSDNFQEYDLSKVEKKDCFHSIGFDFFKIKSILNNGILSQDELKKRNILVPRNFIGGNFDRWISIVDASFYEEYTIQNEIVEWNKNHPNEKKTLGESYSYAAGMFAHQGITFFCVDVPFIEPVKSNNREEALEKGLPWDKSGYRDERYAYNSINPDNIVALFLPAEWKEKSVRDLRYIYESTNMDIVRNRVDYYIKYTQTPKSFIEIDSLNKLLDAYERLILHELKKPHGEGNSKEYFENSRRIMDSINRVIGEMIYNYYKQELGVLFEVKDVVRYELSKVEGISFDEYYSGSINPVNENEAKDKEVLFVIHRQNIKDNSNEKSKSL